jgi:hypothetical protein
VVVVEEEEEEEEEAADADEVAASGETKLEAAVTVASAAADATGVRAS